MRILAGRAVPAMTGIQQKHISHLGFVGGPTGPHGLEEYKVLPEILTLGAMRRSMIPSRGLLDIVWVPVPHLP